MTGRSRRGASGRRSGRVGDEGGGQGGGRLPLGQRFGGRPADAHQGRAQKPVVMRVSGLDHADHGTGRLVVVRDLETRLVSVRIEGVTDGIDPVQPMAGEGLREGRVASPRHRRAIPRSHRPYVCLGERWRWRAPDCRPLPINRRQSPRSRSAPPHPGRGEPGDEYSPARRESAAGCPSSPPRQRQAPPRLVPRGDVAVASVRSRSSSASSRSVFVLAHGSALRSGRPMPVMPTDGAPF